MNRPAALTVSVILAVVAIGLGALGAVRSTSLPYPVLRAATEMTDAYGRFEVGRVRDGEYQGLTHGGNSMLPSWSPDGRQIAFLRGDDETYESDFGWEKYQVWVMDADGGNARAVTGSTEMAFIAPTWMPDGRSLVYPVGKQLFRVDVTTGESAELVESASWWGYTSLFEFTSDGRFLLYTERDTLQRLDLQSGETQELLTGVAWPRESQPPWYDGGMAFTTSPDGQSVATGTAEGTLTIFDLEDGSHQELVSKDFNSVNRVSWSPRGDWLVMRAESLVTPGDDGSVWAYNLESGESWQVSANTDVQYEWTPSGLLLNTRSTRLGGPVYYVTDLERRESDMRPDLQSNCDCGPSGIDQWGNDWLFPR